MSIEFMFESKADTILIVMKIFKKVLKWTGLSIGLTIALIMLAGLSYRLLGPSPHQPMGQLVDIDGFRLHINPAGLKSDKPTLVIEGGGGLASEYYHWLNHGLKDSMRVVRYDRAGIGYSDECETPRKPETIARELHTLLEKAGEKPPYILAGHSIGGPYISVFKQLYPAEVKALVFLDPTHPERVERLDLPKESSWTMKAMLWSYKGLGILGDLGILGLYDRFWGPIIPVEGLPDEIADRTTDFLLEGKLARTVAQEMKMYHSTLKRAGKATQFGSMPIRFFKSAKGASEKAKEVYRKRGINLEQRGRDEQKMVDDFVSNSTDSKVFPLNGDHNSMYTIKENADIICREVLQLLRDLE